MKPTIAFIITLIAFFVLIPTAYAKPKVAVLDLEVVESGKMLKKAALAAANFTKNLRAQATRPDSKYQIASNSAKSLLELKLLSDCSDEGRVCMSNIGKELGADLLVYGKLERSKKGYKISLKLLNTKTKKMEKTLSKNIPFAHLHNQKSADWASTLYAKLIGMKVAPEGTLHIAANIDEATILIDGKVATTLRGGGAKVLGLSEGVHDIVIEADGYQSYQAELSIESGQTESLSVSMSKLDDGEGLGDSVRKPEKNQDNADSRKGWKLAFTSGAILTAGLGGAWAYSGYQYGFLGGGYLQETKTRSQKLVDEENEIALQINPNYKTDQSLNCTDRGNVSSSDQQNPTFKKYANACKQGDKWAKRSTYFGIATGVAAAATAFFGYQGYVVGRKSNKEKRRRASNKSNKKSKIKNVVVMPHISPESIGAGLSLEF